MFKHGLVDSEHADDLVAILADPKRAKKLLDDLKSETKRLDEARKELTKGRTVEAYSKEEKARLDEFDAQLAIDYNELHLAREEFKAEKEKELKKLKDISDSISKREAVALKKEKDLGDKESKLAGLEKLLKEKEEAAQEAAKYAAGIRKEYEDKLADLKERMKGL